MYLSSVWWVYPGARVRVRVRMRVRVTLYLSLVWWCVMRLVRYVHGSRSVPASAQGQGYGQG